MEPPAPESRWEESEALSFSLPPTSTLSQARFLLLLAAQGPGLKAHWFSNVQSTHFHAFLQNVVSPELRFFSLVHFLVSRGYNLPTSEGVITMYRCQRSSPRDLPELGEGPPTLQESTPHPPPLGLLLELTPCSPAITKSQFFEELIGQVTNSQLFLCTNSFFLKILFIFRERGREGERDGEKHRCVVASITP